MATLQAQSTGEDSNSSDTAASDHGDMDHIDGLNGSLDHQRHSFPGMFGLPGIPGLLPGPSGMHGADSFGKFLGISFFSIFFLSFYCLVLNTIFLPFDLTFFR